MIKGGDSIAAIQCLNLYPETEMNKTSGNISLM